MPGERDPGRRPFADEADRTRGNWRFCRAGEVTFMLGRCPNVPPASELGDHSYVAYLRVDDVDGHRFMLGQPIEPGQPRGDAQGE